MKTYTTENYREAQALRSQKLTKRKIAEITGINFETLRQWFEKGYKPRHSRACADLPEYRENPGLYITPSRESSYAYILGQYLGDGYIMYSRRTWDMRIHSDKKYEGLNQLTERHLSILFPESKVRRKNRPGCWQIRINNPLIPHLFPQHGSGKKWARKIVLTEWQTEIIHRHPKAFIAGLIYSDGCIFGPTGRELYNFSQRSNDIMNIFLEYAGKLGLTPKIPRSAKGNTLSVTYGNQHDRNILTTFIRAKQLVNQTDQFDNLESASLSDQRAAA